MKRTSGTRPFLAYLWFAAAVFWVILAAVDGFQTSLYLIAAALSVLAGLVSLYTHSQRRQSGGAGFGGGESSSQPKKKKRK